MALTVGIIGLPNTGKSTLLNALANAGAESSNYPFCTIERNRGVVTVPDDRLDKLSLLLEPDEVIPSTVTFVDIAGLVKGASKGEGLGNMFLHHIREANVLAHVLRCFDDSNISHVTGDIDPIADKEIVETELFLADLERVDKWIEKERDRAKAKKKEERRELLFLLELREKLAEGARIETAGMPEYKLEIMDELKLLTVKPTIFLLNVGEGDIEGESDRIREAIEAVGMENSFIMSAKLDAEIGLIPEEDRADFVKELGADMDAKGRFIEKCHELLGLIRYYTTANEKLQAWSIEKGTTAPKAAGKIHGDMEKGFIRAEVMSFEDLVSSGSRAEVQHLGRLRIEGHDYVVKDGDVIKFLFSG